VQKRALVMSSQSPVGLWLYHSLRLWLRRLELVQSMMLSLDMMSGLRLLLWLLLPVHAAGECPPPCWTNSRRTRPVQ
jgi:hypothetical protein